MDALTTFFVELKKQNLVTTHLLGFFHIMVARKIMREGAPISNGLAWRELANVIKKARWDPEMVRELGLEPDDLPVRDRQRFWYTAIVRAQIDSPKAHEAGDKFAEVLRQNGYEVGPGKK